MGKLNNKFAIVTGGNSGIGYETAKAFSQEGARVLITGRNKEKLEKAAEELGVDYFIADASKSSDIKELKNRIEAEGKKVDIIFNNAGVFFPSQVGSIDEQQIDAQFDINFKGAVLTVENLVPYLNENSSVINLSSVNAITGMPGTAIYAATKAALNSYTRTAAKELAGKGIRVNAINPGPIETPIFAKTGMSEEQLNGFAESIIGKVPLMRFGKPQEVAKLAVFLASEDSSYITGSEFTVDGGLTIIG